jgi:transcriptional regulator with PAS, ATPase and Fis domain
MSDWSNELPIAITVCDTEGDIMEMNKRSCETFAKYGGDALVGTNLMACHPEPARTKLAEMLANPVMNAYTIEKEGLKKLIYQVPWYINGQYQGFVELSLPLPADMPHFVRK